MSTATDTSASDGSSRDEPQDHGGQGSISQHSRDHLREHVDHICHMLSEQGPMSVTFVHNNTLLGLQQHNFEEAIQKAQAFIGGQGYLDNSEYRNHYRRDRITDADIGSVMARREDLELDEVLASVDTKPITSETVLRLHLINGLNGLSASDLRNSAVEAAATRSFRSDLPPETRAAILANTEAQLDRVKQRIGVDLTLAGWLQELLNVDILGHIRRDVSRALVEGRTATASATSILRDLHIPPESWSDYQSVVDQHLDGFVEKEKREPALELWLQAEMQAISCLARRNFDLDGTFDTLINHFKANLEEYAVTGMWAASLSRLGLSDPFSAVDSSSLQEYDVWLDAAEHLANRIHHMERWGGPPVPIDSEFHAEITTLVEAELARLGDIQDGEQDTLERAHLCWVVLHDLGELYLNRRGFEAFRVLLSLADTPAQDDILARVEMLDPRQSMHRFAEQSLAADIASLTSGKSHVDFIRSLTGENLVERVNDYMIGLCSAFFDEGLAAWHLPSRTLGFYEAWRNLAVHDRTFDLDGLSGWREAIHHLPILPVDAVIIQLQSLGIPESDWPDYCGRVLVDLKGWAGMVFWRQLNSDYSKQQAHPIDIMQYLAVRLFYQNQLVDQACRNHWQIRSNIDDLQQYFATHLSEYMLCKFLHTGELPDYLAEQVRTLTDQNSSTGNYETDRWKNLADTAWMHLENERPAREAGDRGWRLFNLAQFLGLDADRIRALSGQEVAAFIGCLDGFPEESHGPVWLHAFELHYRNEVLNAMSLNRGRGRWMKRDRRPKSQVVFCIDEREESIHRHYEELDPEHETLGAAGFFGVAMDYTGLDEHHHTPLCPAPVTPAHSVHEVARPVDEHARLPAHRRQSNWLGVFHDTFWEMKRNVVGSYFLIDIAGFLAAFPLLGRIFFPLKYFATVRAVRNMFVPTVNTCLTVTRSEEEVSPAEESPEQDNNGHAHGNPLGFTLTEQADRSEGLLRNIGLIQNFAPIVVFCAHGSHSENNPHENAHDCGACGGKHGAPNSRVLAAMVNTPQVRELLHQRGIIIPKDTWFVGATHNTANDVIDYFDEEDVPEAVKENYNAIVADLQQATMRAARERCRRFASAPKDVSIEASFRHTQARAFDFSQVRPEWGHATNAFAVVGRRGITQGVFFDRRPFVISYDPSTDPTGVIVERILLAVGPVGAGINLEYYFSTVDPKVYGSDTKVPHNVTGLIGVMEGASSDLRTGLPRQMTEVHEAMRLNLVVDAPMEILGEIYGRQPGIQQLLDGHWVILIAHDPETGEFNQFVPGVGFEKWDDSQLQPIPEVANSYAWFKGKHEKFLPPALITEPSRSWVN